MNTLLLNQFLNISILIVVSGVAVLIPLVYKVTAQWMNERYKELPENIRANLENAAILGARFAEQLGATAVKDGVKMLGKEKMEKAISSAVNYIEAQGYDVDKATELALEALIENVIFAGLLEPEAVVYEKIDPADHAPEPE